MSVSDAMVKMIQYYARESGQKSHHDINHFQKVWAFAKTIGELEGLDAYTQETLELAAIVHDIACPLCREKSWFKIRQRSKYPINVVIMRKKV